MDNPQDDKLTSLYRQRKLQIETPDSIRRVALKHAKERTANPETVWWNFGRQLSLATGFACIVMLGILVNYTMSDRGEFKRDETVVEITRLSTVPHSIRETLNEDYRQATNRLAQRQLTTAIHHKQVAQLAYSEAGWEVKMCDNKSLQISSLLLAELAANNALALDAHQGDFVELAFSDTGLLIGITKTNTPLHC